MYNVAQDLARWNERSFWKGLENNGPRRYARTRRVNAFDRPVGVKDEHPGDVRRAEIKREPDKDGREECATHHAGFYAASVHVRKSALVTHAS
jgi:hypothetical protein